MLDNAQSCHDKIAIRRVWLTWGQCTIAALNVHLSRPTMGAPLHP
jgi:hypothetical protein